MTLQEFYDELEKYDWYCAMSDDARVFENGKRNEQRMKSIAAWMSMQAYYAMKQLRCTIIKNPALPI